jgi:hypothetical protein
MQQNWMEKNLFCFLESLCSHSLKNPGIFMKHLVRRKTWYLDFLVIHVQQKCTLTFQTRQTSTATHEIYWTVRKNADLGKL